MKIVVIRHGEAVFANADRILSERGISEASATASKLSSLITPTRFFSSPKTRAMQTANIIAKATGFSDKIDYISALTPSGDAHEIIRFIDLNCDDSDTVVLVSHLPLVEILSYDLNKKLVVPPRFDTACALIMNYDGNRAVYERFVSPFEDDYIF